MNATSAFVHVNRMGESYYLQEGKTSSGKPKYYTGRKLTGKALDAVPDGYEVHEKPDTAQVVVRKVKPSPISTFERRIAEDIVRRTSGLDHFVVEIEDNALVVYTPSVSRAEHDDFVERLAGPFFGKSSRMADEFRESRIKGSRYEKMLRFELMDADARYYRAERWCFRGSIDRWIPLGSYGPLDVLVATYAQHLDRESFFDLMM